MLELVVSAVVLFVLFVITDCVTGRRSAHSANCRARMTNGTTDQRAADRSRAAADKCSVFPGGQRFTRTTRDEQAQCSCEGEGAEFFIVMAVHLD
jgi:hypothetical protein